MQVKDSPSNCGGSGVLASQGMQSHVSPVVSARDAHANSTGLAAGQGSITGSTHNAACGAARSSPWPTAQASVSACMPVVCAGLPAKQTESGTAAVAPSGATSPSAAAGQPASSKAVAAGVSESQMLTMMQGQGLHMHGGMHGAHMGFAQGMSLPPGINGMQMVTMPGANGQQTRFLIPVQGAYGMAGGVHPMMAANAPMGFVRGPQGQLLRPVLQAQGGGLRGVPVSGAMPAASMHGHTNSHGTGGEKGSIAEDKGSPAVAADKMRLKNGGQAPENNGALNVGCDAAAQHAQAQAQLQGLVALPAGALGGNLTAAQMMGGPGGLCLVPRHALQGGAQGLGVAGMQGSWVPQMNHAAVGMQKQLVQGADFMQLQAAQGAGGFAMQWPQGRCV